MVTLHVCCFHLWLHLFSQPEEELDPEERDNFLQQLYKFMEDRGNTEFSSLFLSPVHFINGTAPKGNSNPPWGVLVLFYFHKAFFVFTRPSCFLVVTAMAESSAAVNPRLEAVESVHGWWNPVSREWRCASSNLCAQTAVVPEETT